MGSTGSIGRNTLQVAAMFPGKFAVKALTAKRNVALLAEQIARFAPAVAAVFDRETGHQLKQILPAGVATEVLWGPEGYLAAATCDSADTVVSAMVGAAGLKPTLAAINARKTVALANKETLVMAGELVMQQAAAQGTCIMPIDSEHSAIFQCLQGNRREDLHKILLTASGGPFLDKPAEAFRSITPEQALAHPNWQMGAKISIDSATLMNKGLEVIEAMHLFAVTRNRIQVVVHPQSIIHSMVAYRDGSILAQMGVPDMKEAIAYALSCPERLALNQPLPDFAALGGLTFQDPDMAKFPCLTLAYRAGDTGGTLPAVLNAANEVAVAAFLDRKIGFAAIPEIIEQTMLRHDTLGAPGLDDILIADMEARLAAEQLIAEHSGRI